MLKKQTSEGFNTLNTERCTVKTHSQGEVRERSLALWKTLPNAQIFLDNFQNAKLTYTKRHRTNTQEYFCFDFTQVIFTDLSSCVDFIVNEMKLRSCFHGNQFLGDWLSGIQALQSLRKGKGC